MPHYSLRSHKKMAGSLHRAALKSNFDLATAQEVKLEHTIMVPLHFITPDMNIPIIPLYNGGLAPPAPSARRCYSLGRMVGRFVENWEGDEFSLGEQRMITVQHKVIGFHRLRQPTAPEGAGA